MLFSDVVCASPHMRENDNMVWNGIVLCGDPILEAGV